MKTKSYKKKLPEKILLALAIYYINRTNKGQKFSFGGSSHSSDQTVYELIEHKTSTWNKEEDFDRVCHSAKKFSYGTQAIAGTFWFNKGKCCFEINENTFPIAYSVVKTS